MIAQGLVRIDGAVVGDPGHKIVAGQTLEVCDTGAALFSVVIHKPVGVVSAQPERGQIPAARLLTRANLGGPEAAIPEATRSLAPLGRLDMDSRGLLILSEDGVLAKALIGPASALDKEYQVRVTGAVTERKIRLLRHGLHLDGRELKPAQVTHEGEDALRLILHEGRNRQIRRMCEAVDLTVVDLFRVRIGPLKLGALPVGTWRALTHDERASLIEGAACGAQ